MSKWTITILTLALFLTLSACSDGKGESTKEVIDKYTKTLSEAPDKARKAAEQIEKSQDRERRIIEEEEEAEE